MKRKSKFFNFQLSHNGDYAIFDLTPESVTFSVCLDSFSPLGICYGDLRLTSDGRVRLSPCRYIDSPFVYRLVRRPIPRSLRRSRPVLELLSSPAQKFIVVLPRYISAGDCYFVNCKNK